TCRENGERVGPMNQPAAVVALLHSLNGGVHGDDVGAGISAATAFSQVRAVRQELIVTSVAVVVVYETHVLDGGREEASIGPLIGWESRRRGCQDVIDKCVGLEACANDRHGNVASRTAIGSSRTPDWVLRNDHYVGGEGERVHFRICQIVLDRHHVVL